MDDLIINVMLNMTPKEILKKASIDKQWNKIVSDDKFWCKLLERDYPDYTIMINISLKNNYYNQVTQRGIPYEIDFHPDPDQPCG